MLHSQALATLTRNPTLILLGCLAGSLASCQHYAGKSYQFKFVPGKTAKVLPNGHAVAPRKAPKQVHTATIAANKIHGRPYRYGGGHRRVEDSAYDCSGAVSYALIKAGLLDEPTTSTALRSYGKPGKGKWITVYSKSGHTFMTVADLRFDTGWGRGAKGPRWRSDSRPTKGYVMRHPPGL